MVEIVWRNYEGVLENRRLRKLNAKKDRLPSAQIDINAINYSTNVERPLYFCINQLSTSL